MPLLLFASSLYSARTLKSVNFCFEMMLLPPGALFVSRPSSISQLIGLRVFCTSNSVAGSLSFIVWS